MGSETSTWYFPGFQYTWRKSQIKPLTCKDTASYSLAQREVQPSLAKTRWHRVSQISSFSLFWIPLTLLRGDPHRFVRAVHGLHEAEGGHGGGADGVGAAQAEPPQWGALVGGTGVAVHPGTGRTEPREWVCPATASSGPPLSSSRVWPVSEEAEEWPVGGLTCSMPAARPAG